MNNLDFSLFPPINWRWSLGRTCLVADVMINTTGVLLLVLVPGRGRLHREKLLLPLGQGQVSLRPLLRPPPGRGDRAWIRPTTLRRRGAKVFTHRGETSTPTIDRRSGRSNSAALGCNRGRCLRTLIIILIILKSILTSSYISVQHLLPFRLLPRYAPLQSANILNHLFHGGI